MGNVAEREKVYRKTSKKCLIKHDKNNYVIVDGAGRYSITPNKRHATVFHSTQEAEDCLRELWIDGEILTA